MTGMEKDPKLMNDLQDIIEGDGRTIDAAVKRIEARKALGRRLGAHAGRQRKYEPGVTAVMPCIPPRSGHDVPGTMPRAMKSILSQTRPVDVVVLAFDHHHEGAAATRNRALAAVRTEWVAFLDDDDEWLPGHVERLLSHAEKTGADVVYPWFDVPEGFDPFPFYEGKPFNEKALRDVQNYIPVTVLARTGLLTGVGGFENRNDSTADGASPCEEWGLWLKLLDIGAVFSHCPERTWLWHWHGGNTSGRGDRW